jgi:hypothetical protein
MNNIKCSDYYILKINLGEDKKNKLKSPEGHWIPSKQFWKRVDSYHKFFDKFLKKVTGLTLDEYRVKYFFGTNDCVKEELFDLYDINIFQTGISQEMYIFKKENNEDLFNWILENCDENPIKIIKKVSLCLLNHKKTRRERDHTLNFMKTSDSYKNFLEHKIE